MKDFYIDRLPNHCDYLAPYLFFNQPRFEANLQIVDSRWRPEEIQKIVEAPVSYGYSNFFEVTDMESNMDGSENWVCGFSVYFLKRALNPTQLHRETSETHQKLIDGVEVLINHPERSQETVLRFYVSAEAWEVISARGLLNRKHTQFYKMQHASEDSQIGTMWRLMVLDDSDYEYAIQADVAPDEDWIIPRIADWGHREFLQRLGKFAIASEIQALEYEREPSIEQMENLRIGIADYPNLTRFDHLTAGGIVTVPRKIPPLVPLFCKYLETDSTLTVFHHEYQTWTRLTQPDHFYHGWQGLGPDQNVWRFLKRSMLARHAVYEPFAKNFRAYPVDHYFFRMVRQLEKSGHEFIIDKTQQPLLEFIDSTAK